MEVNESGARENKTGNRRNGRKVWIRLKDVGMSKYNKNQLEVKTRKRGSGSKEENTKARESGEKGGEKDAS